MLDNNKNSNTNATINVYKHTHNIGANTNIMLLCDAC